MPKKDKDPLQAYYKDPSLGLLEAGLDEAGKGSYISRVYAGAVIWDPELSTSLIRDSKQYSSHRQRLIAYDFIKEHCPAYGVGWAEREEIDQMGIGKANMLAMYRALDTCQIAPDFLLIDGDKRQFNGFRYTTHYGEPVSYATVPKGDDTFLAIAAASIVAKVERDLYIDKLCDENPQLELYNIRSNKGYGSKQHEEALEHWGMTPHHRQSWKISKKFNTTNAN